MIERILRYVKGIDSEGLMFIIEDGYEFLVTNEHNEYFRAFRTLEQALHFVEYKLPQPNENRIYSIMQRRYLLHQLLTN